MDTKSYRIETAVDGEEVVRWDTQKKYTPEELKKQRTEFEKLSAEGKRICLTDLMINHGM